MSDLPQFWLLVALKWYSYEFWSMKYAYFTPWLMYLFVSALYWILFWMLVWGRYLRCFIRICIWLTVKNDDVLLNYMGTPQWGPYNWDSMGITLLTLVKFLRNEGNVFSCKGIAHLPLNRMIQTFYPSLRYFLFYCSCYDRNRIILLFISIYLTLTFCLFEIT